MIRLWPALIMLLTCLSAQAQDITLAASPALIESGVMKHLLPRFSLKTGVKVGLVPLETKGADVVLSHIATHDARAVMQGLGQTFYLAAVGEKSQKSTKFIDWLHSDIGKRTIAAFKRDGVQVFQAVAGAPVVVEERELTGDIALGRLHSFKHCARCHVIGPENRMNGLGSTPSFALMRTFPDWQQRYGAFFTLNPHPSFTQITDVTDPFDPTLPPPISPLVLTLTQLDDILAFVATIQPADLGGALVHQ